MKRVIKSQEIKPNNDILNSSREITSVAKGAGVVFAGTIIGTVLRYLFRAIIGRFIGPTQVGLFFIGLGVFRITEKIACLGIQNGILRYVSIYKGEGDDKRVKGIIVIASRIILAVGIVIGFFVALLSPAIANKIYHQPDLINILRLFGLAVPFSALIVVFVFSTQALRIMKYKVIVREIFEPLLRIILFIGFIFLGWKLFGAIWAFVISTVFGLFLAFHYLKKLFPELMDKDFKPIYETRKLLHFSWPLFFASFFYLVFLWANTLIIGYFLSPREVGIFGAAHNTVLLSQVVLNSFVSIFAPVISDLNNRQEMNKLHGLFKIVTKWVLTLSFPLFILMVYFAKEILDLSFGKDFIGGANCIVILSIGFFMNCVFGSSGFLLVMSGKPRIEFYNLCIVLTANIVMSIILIPEYGIVGAAYSASACFILLNILRFAEVHLLLKMNPLKGDMYKPLFGGGIAFIGLVLLARILSPVDHSLLFLLTGTLIFMIVYALILMALGFDDEDKIVFAKIKEKMKLT